MAVTEKVRARELTDLAHEWLRARFPKAHIRRELSLGAWASAAIDVAAICEDQIVGVEIKGDGDSPSRLKLQGAMYGRACRKVYLLSSPALADRCYKHKPPEWDMLWHPDVDRITGTKCVETGIRYSDWCGELRRGEGLGLSPAALVDLLWVKEIPRLRMLLPTTEHTGWPKQKGALVEYVVQRFPLPVIEKAVFGTLRQRDWFDDRTDIPTPSDRKEE